jgi:hypothetical protein
MVYVLNREVIASAPTEPFDTDRDVVAFLQRRGCKITTIHQCLYIAQKKQYRFWDGGDYTEQEVK